jgi:general stress protein 26
MTSKDRTSRRQSFEPGHKTWFDEDGYDATGVAVLRINPDWSEISDEDEKIKV